MAFAEDAGKNAAATLIAGAEQLLGRPLQDSEKAMMADIAQQIISVENNLKSVIDYAVDKLAGKRIVIEIEDKPPQT